MKLLATLAAFGFTLGFAAAAPPGPDANPGHLKLALVNIRCLTSAGPDAAANRANLDANVKRHLAFIDRAAGQGAEFVGFPELSVNGYHFSDKMTWLSLDGPEVKTLAAKAVERGVYVAAGLAEQDADGKRWNTHIVLDPAGKLIGKHRKIYLTKEKGFVEVGTRHDVFEVKGLKVGIAICADGSDRKNLQALVDGGAKLIYGPHANTTGGTVAGWYKFRAGWAGPTGWVAELKVHAALHNHAGVYGPDLGSPAAGGANAGWASGAWVLGPDGKTLAQMPTSTARGDSAEYVLTYNVPVRSRPRPRPSCAVYPHGRGEFSRAAALRTPARGGDAVQSSRCRTRTPCRRRSWRRATTRRRRKPRSRRRTIRRPRSSRPRSNRTHGDGR